MSGRQRLSLIAGVLLVIAAVGWSVTTLLDPPSGPVEALFRWGLVIIWLVTAYANFAQFFAGRRADRPEGGA